MLDTRINWDTLKDFLAVAREGSLSGAARVLKTSQPTVGRRLEALEDELGTPLFLRAGKGLQLTAAGEHILRYAEQMEDSMIAVERSIKGDSATLSGSITIATVEGLAATWLPTQLIGFREQYPDMTIDIKTGFAPVDLSRGEADLAIRNFRPEQNDLVGKMVGKMSFVAFASQEYLDRKGRPKSPAEMGDHDMILPSREVAQYINPTLKKKNIRTGHVAFSSNSTAALITATLKGYGIGYATMNLAEVFPALIPVFDDPAHDITIPLWLVYHKDMRRSPRLRAMVDFLSERFEACKTTDNCLVRTAAHSPLASKAS